MSIYNTAVEKSLRETDSDDLQQVAMEALKTLYKIKMTIREGLKQCVEGEDWIVPVNMINGQIDMCHDTVDNILGIGGKIEPDTTDLTQDEQAVSIVSPNKAA